MIALMDTFNIYFGLELASLIFTCSITEQLSITLQEKSRWQMRSSMLPRQRNIPRRVNNGEPRHRFKSVEDIYRKEYFEIIDGTIGGLERRFMQPHFDIVRNIESVLIDSANRKATMLTTEFVSLYANDIDMEKLQLQLKLLPDAVKTAAPDGIEIHKVTRIQTLLEDIKLLRIYLTIPVTTASSERNFSGLKRIKTYLRNSMTQCRLNNCMLLHIHTNITDKIDTKRDCN